MYGLLRRYDYDCTSHTIPWPLEVIPTAHGACDRPAADEPTPTTSQRFRQEGCPNCEEFLHLKGDPDAIDNCTSQVYEGLITLANPAKSWVAKWQRLDNYVQGVYAIKVSGQLPDEVRTSIEEQGHIYIP